MRMGISMLLLSDALGISGRMTRTPSSRWSAAMLGATNAASSMILKWKLQFACALVWWAAAVVPALAKSKQLTIAFLAAIFFCQIVFGIYG
jgi:hypothetical protein